MAATTVADKIAEIERKQHFTSDWFEESLQEMADFVKYKYDIIEKNNIALVNKCDEYRDRYYKTVKEKGDRVNSEPLTAEKLTAAGWKVDNENTFGKMLSIDITDEEFITIRFYHRNGVKIIQLDTTREKADALHVSFRRDITVGEFNNAVALVGLDQFKI